MICHKLNVTTPEKEGTTKFEFQKIYISQGGMHQMICGFEQSMILCLSTGMDLLTIDAKGVISRVGIWPMEMQDSLDSVMSTAIGAIQSLALTIGDVLEIPKHEVELVRMSLPNPWVDQRPIKDKGKTMNMKTNDVIAVSSSSLMYCEDWDLAESNTFLEKIQHKLQQTTCIVDQIWKFAAMA